MSARPTIDAELRALLITANARTREPDEARRQIISLA